MNDKELLELAAKAAGMDVQRVRLDDPLFMDFLITGEGVRNSGQRAYPWNPITDDGDALRLAVKCGINIDMEDQSAWHRKVGFFVQEYWGGDYDPCYRRAIVRAAAEIGKSL